MHLMSNKREREIRDGILSSSIYRKLQEYDALSGESALVAHISKSDITGFIKSLIPSYKGGIDLSESNIDMVYDSFSKDLDKLYSELEGRQSRTYFFFTSYLVSDFCDYTEFSEFIERIELTLNSMYN